MTSLMTPLNAA